MSLAKFLSLLTRSSIYFCQALKLRSMDPFEGTLAGLNRVFYELMTNNEMFARQFMRLGPNDPLPPNYKDVFSATRQRRMRDIFASTTYVNCWNISEHESAFLWSMYASPTDGIAVQSTVARFRESIGSEKRDIYIGPVTYIDFTSEVIPEDNLLNALFRKRKSFEAERELRACFMHQLDGVGWSEEAIGKNPIGHYISCDLSVLIDHIYISPAAPDWYSDAVADTLRKMSYKFRIIKSSLSEAAVF